VVEFYLKLKLILRIISYLTYICWETDNFVIKSYIFRRFFICKNILKKLSCYHDNNFRYFMFGKYNGFVSKARVSACMYFLVIYIKLSILSFPKSNINWPLYSILTIDCTVYCILFPIASFSCGYISSCFVTIRSSLPHTRETC
jgi:hypothetical protein